MARIRLEISDEEGELLDLLGEILYKSKVIKRASREAVVRHALNLYLAYVLKVLREYEAGRVGRAVEEEKTP